MFFFLLLVMTVYLSPAVSLAVIYTVPGDYPTIQQAIDAASPGDTVLVSPGTYPEFLDFLGKEIVLTSVSGAEYTIIDGNGAGRPVTINSGEGPGTVLNGFTVANGLGWPGGGILVDSGSAPFITDCIITGCWGYNHGGAICIQSSSPVILGNTIVDNFAFSGPTGYGGAIYSFESSASIHGNIITLNDAENGSAFYLSADSSVISNNLIVGNPNTYFTPRGTIHAYGSQTIFINNTVADNEVHAFWGDGSQMDIVNCIIWGNGPEQFSGSFNITWSDIQDGHPGIGNINDTPCFIPGPLSEYHLVPDSSPCIDVGNPDTFYNDPEDPGNPGYALWPALGGLHNDMGAYGGGGVGYWVGIEESILHEDLPVLRAFPNPFRGSMTLEFELSESCVACLDVYDISGRLIHRIADGSFDSGRHTAIWNPDPSLADGCYLLVLNTSGVRSVQRCVKLN